MSLECCVSREKERTSGSAVKGPRSLLDVIVLKRQSRDDDDDDDGRDNDVLKNARKWL